MQLPGCSRGAALPQLPFFLLPQPVILHRLHGAIVKETTRMNNYDAAFIAWVQQYWNWILFLAGALLVTGSTRDWDWLCDPDTSPFGQRFSRKSRRVFFFILGVILIFVCVWQWNQAAMQ